MCQHGPRTRREHGGSLTQFIEDDNISIFLPKRTVFASVFATMPTYEYTCQKCGHHFDLFQSITEKPISTCPKAHCPQKRWGKGKVARGVGGGAGLIFKGTGFYITDYRSEKYKEAAKKDAAPAATSKDTKSSSGSSSTPAKTEAKPAKSSSSSG